MSKISSYRKMKQKYEAEINELRSDIICLVSENELDSLAVKMRWKTKIELGKMMFPVDGYVSNGLGIIPKITKGY